MKDDLRDLPLMKAPDSVWASIEASLDAKTKAKPVSRLTWTLGIAAAGTVVLATGAWWATRPPKPAWQVVRVDGKLTEHGKIQVGDWLQTDGSSRARISVGDIGTIDVAPNTRVRMVASQPGEQRLRLARGEISASVTAPPRLFLVDTPASTAVDLGCAYTMKADEDGSGFLHVTLGWVSLEWAGRESLVPAEQAAGRGRRSAPGHRISTMHRKRYRTRWWLSISATAENPRGAHHLIPCWRRRACAIRSRCGTCSRG